MDEKGIHRFWRMRSASRKAWSMFFVAAVLVASLWGHEAFATLYDDFSSGGINSTLWVTSVPNGFLSVVPGSSQPYVLHATGTGTVDFPRAGLTTTSTFSGDFHAGINFFNFSSTGPYVPGQTDQSNPAISLVIRNTSPGSTDKYFLVSMLLRSDGYAMGYREMDSTGTVLSGGSLGPYVLNSGGLVITYMGGEVYLNYSTSTDPNMWHPSGDLHLLKSFAYTFTAPPRLSISATPGGAGTLGGNLLNADVGGLYYGPTAAPVPLPGALWLLGSGLIGIIGIRRRFKK